MTKTTAIATNRQMKMHCKGVNMLPERKGGFLNVYLNLPIYIWEKVPKGNRKSILTKFMMTTKSTGAYNLIWK